MTTKNTIGWIASALTALLFLFSGGVKLIDVPMTREAEQLFASFGYPHWFMIFTGIMEVTGAVLLLIPMRLAARVGATFIAIVMVGAAYSHLSHGQPSHAVPTIVLGLLAIAAGTLRTGPSTRQRALARTQPAAKA